MKTYEERTEWGFPGIFQSCFLCLMCGIKHTEHQWSFVGSTGPIGVRVQGRCGYWYLVADAGWVSLWGQPVTIQPEAQIYLACGYIKMLFILWLLLLLPCCNLSILFPPGTVVPGRDREWFGERSWSRKRESQNNISWLKSSCSPFF